MLAQLWLYGRRVPTKHDDVLERHLKLPHQFNPHSSVAVLNNLAERIVFTDDVPSLLYSMHDNRQLTYEGVITSAKLPYDCFWIEYRSVIGVEGIIDLDAAQYGALIMKYQDRVRMYVVIGSKFHEGSISSLAYVLEFHEWPPRMCPHPSNGRAAIQFYVNWAHNRKDLAANDAQAHENLGGIVTELIFGIFLVTQPKVYTEQRVEWAPKKQAARAKHGKPPLLEYRHIRMRISKPIKRYVAQSTAIRAGFAQSITHEADTESEDAITHRRYHKVMGHFRHYIRRDPSYSVWIEPHYRGDPALGITFTERDVTK